MLCQAKSRPGKSGFSASTPMKLMAAQMLMEHTCQPVLKHDLDCLAQVRIISNHGHVWSVCRHHAWPATVMGRVN
jgi:hypothetical protein